ncbi:MAG: IPT/TIG domain-containing protein, partial [Candidatus Dormibacteraeota bacterium]|nr:IPT/TIG domain-containing protein [Candidatus Dormibacteraeota bacterium]
GSTKGGQVVQIDGSFFVPDADQVLFGATPGTILAESSTTIIVSAPPGVAGTVPVTVQTPDGTAAAGTFTYITPGQLSPAPTSPGGYHPRR